MSDSQGYYKVNYVAGMHDEVRYTGRGRDKEPFYARDQTRRKAGSQNYDKADDTTRRYDRVHYTGRGCDKEFLYARDRTRRRSGS